MDLPQEARNVIYHHALGHALPDLILPKWMQGMQHWHEYSTGSPVVTERLKEESERMPNPENWPSRDAMTKEERREALYLIPNKTLRKMLVDLGQTVGEPREKKFLVKRLTGLEAKISEAYIAQLEAQVDGLTTRISEMEDQVNDLTTRIIEMEEGFLGHPPSSPITSTSAVDARDQFIIGTEELGRNVASKLSKFPQEYAAKLCRQYLESGSMVGEHGCWVSFYAGMFQDMSSQRLRVV